jgi:hypothetical protein
VRLTKANFNKGDEMNKTTLFLLLLLTLISVPAFAQYDPDYPDYDIGGGGGGGASCHTCEGDSVHGFTCNSDPRANPADGYAVISEFSYCKTYNVPSGACGPSYCEVSGLCWAEASNNGHNGAINAERQVIGITTYFREAKLPDGSLLITQEALEDFIALTDRALEGESYESANQHRLAAFRAEFKRLVGRDLKPGSIPRWGHKPVKAPAATVAAL